MLLRTYLASGAEEIYFDFGVDEVARYVRSGDDLNIELLDGNHVVVSDYFALQESEQPELILETGEKVVLSDDVVGTTGLGDSMGGAGSIAAIGAGVAALAAGAAGGGSDAPSNSAPVAENDTAETIEGKPVTSAVFENDYDNEDGPAEDRADEDAAFSLKDQPQNGTVTDNGDGTFTYTPNPDFVGEDSYTYTYTDSDGNEATGTVNVTVGPDGDVEPNTPPTANDDTAATVEGQSVTTDVSDNDFDPEDGPAGPDDTFELEDEPQNGTVVNNGDGTFTYTPNEGFAGSDSYTYTYTDSDGNQSEPATVEVTVAPEGNASPTANDDTAATVEGQSVTTDVSDN
ncbi:Ig-like domain-containing protein, partial [Shimia aestuarii]|uniref:Ig-like domain-containing protein n=1 Tax=Shimia aestuarii TaxID=254406 RepID=UPI001FB387B3